MDACDSLDGRTLLQRAQHHQNLIWKLVCLIEFNGTGSLSCLSVLEEKLFILLYHLLYDRARFHHEFF